MAWPTDDLTKAHLDASTDDPSQARAEILALLNKVQAILAEVAPGATLWHSNNDGTGSGLDAGRFGGELPSFYRDAGNINSGTLAVERLGSGINAATLNGQSPDFYRNLASSIGQINADQVPAGLLSEGMMAAAAISQSKLKTGSGEQTFATQVAASAILVLPGGDFGFYPRIKGNNPSNGIFAGIYNNIYNVGTTNEDLTYPLTTKYPIVSDASPTSFIAAIHVGSRGPSSGGANITVRQTYISASPPYRIGLQDFGAFIYALLDDQGNIKCTSISDDPTWWILNPKPHGTDRDGNAWRMEYNLPASIRVLRKKDPEAYIIERKKIQAEKRIITRTAKNKFMNELPHPFISKLPTDRVVLLCPSEQKYNLLNDLRDDGESIADLLHDGKIQITDPTDALAPAGVFMHKFRFKSSK